jgi:SAM-dependent methyltransferase
LSFNEVALQKVREDRLLIGEVDQWLYEEIEPYLGQRVLEIGCGLGNFARYLVGRELYIGTDVSQSSVEHLRGLYQGYSNVDVVVADATSAEFRDLGRRNIDTVFSLNVFEHIDDHLAALDNAQALLQPGGRLILVVPAHSWLYGTIDRAIGHYRRYDKAMMAGLFERVGLTCVAQKYINGVGALGWLTSSRIRRQETPPATQLRLFNTLVPYVKRIERLVPTPFGISLLAVGGKKPA